MANQAIRGWAVVTGASSGIGQEMALRLGRRGWRLLLCARRTEALERLAARIRKERGAAGKEDGRNAEVEGDAEIEILTADLSLPEGIEALLSTAGSREIGLFINCAGFGLAGDFGETSLDRELAMIDVNVRAVHILTKKMMLQMEAQGYGRILNVASSAGLLPAGPFLATYYATKAYVASLTQAVAEELRERKSPVRVFCLCPGPVDTEFNAVAQVRFGLPGISARFCADCALKGIEGRRVLIVPSLRMKLVIAGQRLAPRGAVIRLTARQQRKKL